MPTPTPDTGAGAGRGTGRDTGGTRSDPAREAAGGAALAVAPRSPDTGTDDGGGTIFVIGGAEDKIGRRDLLQRFVRRAGSGRIAVVPTASSLGSEVVDLYEALFRRLGASDVVAMRPQGRLEARDPLLAEEVAEFDGVFMTGGNQLKLASVIVGTAFGEAIRSVHRRGGVVGGTSAGASIVSEHMVAGGSGGATPRQSMSQLAQGLGLRSDIVVDQHFRERDRYGRLLALIAQSPNLLGIGIDEDTAAIITGNLLEVAGKGAVTVLDATDAVSSAATARSGQPVLVSGAVVHVLPASARFDLERRCLADRAVTVPPAERAELAATEAGMRRLARRIARESAATAHAHARPADDEETT